MRLYKNSRFQNGCGGYLLYNPIEVVGNTVLTQYDDTNYGYDVVSAPFDTSIYNSVANMMYCFGGQFCGEVHHVDTSVIYLKIPWGTFPYPGDSVAQIGNYINNLDKLILFDADSATPPVSNRIDDVTIMNYSHDAMKKTFGFNSVVYDTRDVYTASILIKPSTDIENIEALLTSNYMAIFANDTTVITETPTPGQEDYIFTKPIGGGSLSPIGRLVTLTDNKIKLPFRRDYTILNVKLNG